MKIEPLRAKLEKLYKDSRPENTRHSVSIEIKLGSWRNEIRIFAMSTLPPEKVTDPKKDYDWLSVNGFKLKPVALDFVAKLLEVDNKIETEEEIAINI
jgi:hypothetical protein